jgi:hypothetical protein
METQSTLQKASKWLDFDGMRSIFAKNFDEELLAAWLTENTVLDVALTYLNPRNVPEDDLDLLGRFVAKLFQNSKIFNDFLVGDADNGILMTFIQSENDETRELIAASILANSD